MTINQLQAIWELCRQGLPLIADEAEERWERGEPFNAEGLRLSRELLGLIAAGNWEAVGMGREPDR